MLKYLRDKLFFDLGSTATTDLSRPLRHDYVAAIFTRHATCRVSGITNSASHPGVYKILKYQDFKLFSLQNIISKA